MMGRHNYVWLDEAQRLSLNKSFVVAPRKNGRTGITEAMQEQTPIKEEIVEEVRVPATHAHISRTEAAIKRGDKKRDRRKQQKASRKRNRSK